MELYDKNGNKVSLVEKFKTITLKAWDGSYPCRGDNISYKICISGVFVDGIPSISGEVAFMIIGVSQATKEVFVAADVTELYSIDQTTTGLVISLNFKTDAPINAGIAIPTTDIVITSA